VVRASHLLAIRPGEGPLVARLAAFFALVEAARGVGEIGADTLVLGTLGAGVLPSLYVGLGVASLVAALAFGAGVGRLPRIRFFAGLLVAAPALLVVERVALAGQATGPLVVLWLSVYVVGAIVATLSWALAGWVLDARQAKRLFPLCASAAIVGGFAGMVAAGPIAAVAGAPDLTLVQAALLATAALLVPGIGGRRTGRAAPRRAAGTIRDDVTAGAGYVRRSPLMRLVAAAYVVFAILFLAVSYPYLSAMTAAFPTDVELATALGLVSASVTAASFLVAVGLANRLYARVGIATVALALPLVYLGGFTVWLVSFGLLTAVAFRFVQQVTQRGLSNAVWSAFYNVVPGERRAQVLAFMDGVPGQLGGILAGLLLLVVGGLASPTPIFVLGIAASLVCLAITIGIRRTYADSLLRTLRSGLGEQLLEGGPGIVALGTDPAVVTSLRTGLTDELPAVRRLSATLLGRLGVRAARSDLEARLDDPSPDVRVAAIAALTAIGTPLDGSRFERSIADPDPAVRAEAAVAGLARGEEEPAHRLLAALIEGATPEERLAGLEAVARLRGHAPSPLLLDALDDPVPEVRSAAVRAVAAVDPPLGDPVPILVAALDDEAAGVRTAAARSLADRGSEVRPRLVGVLRTGSDRAREAALVALEPQADSVRSEIAAWALAEVERAGQLRRQRIRLVGTAPAADGARPGDPRDDLSAACVGYLGVVLGQRERRIEARLVQALAVLGAPDAGGVIRRSLAADDPETRAIATEALDSIGDRRLGRAVVGLLEAEPDAPTDDRADVLRDLARDDDPWTRTLAARAIAARGGTVPEPAGILSEIERMLVLRRVALFADLAPEDLQRIAASAIERLYEPGEALVREGDPGDELIVIVEGTVRVVQRDGDGEREVRTFGPGDHIGELAVLREQRRAATVVAGTKAVRGLAIGGAGLKAILRERPEAAMAMLSTLAERIATQ